MDREAIGKPGPANVVAVILGASEFPHADALQANAAFSGSASAFNAYLKGEHGLHLADAQVLNLFDSDANVIEQNDRLTSHLLQNQNASDLIFYYVGHGGFLPDREYFLALRSTKRGAEGVTGLRIRALAHTLEENFPGKRVFVILDCCFAGEAVAQFQGGELATIVENETFDALPAAGTSLLVAASKDEPAIAPLGAAYTMFSDCFLEVLAQGIADGREMLSLTEIGGVVQKLVRRKFGQRAVRPEIHSPRQGSGDIATFPLFPNPAYVAPDPKALPAAVQDAIRNPLADIRQGAIRSLTPFLESADRDLAKLARAELERLAEHDDSRSVQQSAREALGRGEQSLQSVSPPPIAERASPPRVATDPIPKARTARRALVATIAGLVVLALGVAVFWRADDPEVGTGDGVERTEIRAQQLLDDAQRYLQAGRLDSPEGENALQRYRAVLDLDPDNQAARAGLDRVVTELIEAADRAVTGQELDRAEELLAKAAEVEPDNAKLADIRVRLRKAREASQQLERIEHLLAGAARDFEQGRLDSPKGDNALDGYRAVLAIDPDNQRAQAGIVRLLENYLALADGAIDEGALDEAVEYLAKAEKIAPTSAGVDEVRDRIVKARSEVTGDAQIRRLLAEAERDLQQDRLTTPKGNNAVERYRAVLDRDPVNRAARTGLERVVSRYVALADSAVAGNQLDKADAYVEKAAGIAPANAELESIRVRIAKARAMQANRAKIESLLADANRHLQQNRLDAPQGKNAVEGFKAVLAVDPGNRAAHAGLERVLDRYADLAEGALDARELEKAADYLTRAEGIESGDPRLARIRAELEKARSAPTSLSFAVFPFQSLAVCHYSVRDEVTDAAEAVIRGHSRAKLGYSFYAADANPNIIPKTHELWSDNVARREPRLDTVRKAGRALGVNGVLMAWYKCSMSQHVSADTYEVDVYLVDVVQDRVFHVKENFLDAKRAVSKVFEQFYSAYGVGPG